MSAEAQHHHGKVALEVGAAGLGLAVAGWLVYQRRHAAHEAALPGDSNADFQDKLNILSDARVERVLKHGRKRMAAAAVRVYYASHYSAEGVITKPALQRQLEEAHDEDLHLTADELQKALGFLADKKLVGRKKSAAANSKSQGYCALPALDWAFEQGNCPDVLEDAQAEFLNEQL